MASKTVTAEYTRFLEITMDNGVEFRKLRGYIPGESGTLDDVYVPSIGGTVGQWCEDHPGWRILSYRPVATL